MTEQKNEKDSFNVKTLQENVQITEFRNDSCNHTWFYAVFADFAGEIRVRGKKNGDGKRRRKKTIF